MLTRPLRPPEPFWGLPGAEFRVCPPAPTPHSPFMALGFQVLTLTVRQSQGGGGGRGVKCRFLGPATQRALWSVSRPSE